MILLLYAFYPSMHPKMLVSVLPVSLSYTLKYVVCIFFLVWLLSLNIVRNNHAVIWSCSSLIFMSFPQIPWFLFILGVGNCQLKKKKKPSIYSLSPSYIISSQHSWQNLNSKVIPSFSQNFPPNSSTLFIIQYFNLLRTYTIPCSSVHFSGYYHFFDFW